MIRAERARQFMPFDALTGFKDALKEKEQVHIRRKELSDEANEELSMKLNAIDTNKIVQITYYDGNIYTKIKGKVNKIDKISDEDILYNITEYKDLYPFAEIVPVSALTKDNIKRLIDVIKKYLKDDVKYFPEGMKTSNSKYFMISEIVREKLFDVTVEEIPHSLTCHTYLYEEKKDIINIHVDIIVDRDTIKKIIIGKKGERLKDVGTRARVELEAMLGKKVYLELFVKTIKNWKDKERYIKELGFYE